MSMLERRQSHQAGRCQYRQKDIFSHPSVVCVNVDALFSCSCCSLSFHSEIQVDTGFLVWCQVLPQMCCIQLLICLSLEGSDVPGFFSFSVSENWGSCGGNGCRTCLAWEAKIAMLLCAFSWRFSFVMNWSPIEGCIFSGDIADSTSLIPAAAWVDESEAYWD